MSGASDRGAGAAAVGMLAGGKDADARAPVAGTEEARTAAVEAAEVDTGGGGGAPASVVAAGAAADVEGTVGLEAAAAAAGAAVVSTAACKEAESVSASEMAAAAVLAGNLVRPVDTAAEELDPDLRSAVGSALTDGSALTPGCGLGG